MAETQAPAIPNKSPAAPARAKKPKVPSPPTASEPGPLAVLNAELGISGTVNYDGRVQAEANSKLRDFAARGTPGVGGSWGEWERIRRTDPAVESAINLVSAPLRDAEIEVEPAEDVPGGEEHAEFLRDDLLKWMDPQWSGFVQEWVDTLLTFGFDIHEPVLGTRADPRVPGGTAVFVAKMAQRLPSSLSMQPWHEKNGELDYIQQQGQRSLPDGRVRYDGDIRLPADRVLLTTWNRSGNNYEGFSALRSVWYLCKLREALLKIFAIGSEREALGIPVASVDKDAKLSTQQIQEWQNFLQRIAAHENAAAVPPPGVSFDWKFSPASNKGHVLDAWIKLGIAIHQVFLTQQVALGTTETGSRSVGEVHDASKNDFVSGVKALLEATLNGVGQRPYTGLARRIIELNFGPQTAYPTITLVMKRREVSAQEIASAVPALVTAGLFTARLEDENQVREKLGFGPIAPEEYEAERARKQAMAQAIARGQTNSNPQYDGEGQGEDAPEKAPPKPGQKGPPTDEPAKMSARRNAGADFKREFYDWEQHLDLKNVEFTLDSGRDAFIEKAGALIHSAIAEKLPEIKAAMADGDPSDVVNVKLNLGKLGKLIEKFIASTRADGYAAVARERTKQPAGLIRKREDGVKVASAGGQRVVRLEEDDKGVDTEPAGEPAPAPAAEPEPQTSAADRRKVTALVQRMRDQLLQRMRARVIDDIESEAQYLLRTKGDPADIVQNVTDRALENRGLKFDAGSVQAKAFSMGREEFAQQHANEIAAVKYSAILDSSTCLPCAGEDGKEFDFNSPEHDAHVPPYGECRGGDQCRCLLVYVFNDEGFQPIEEAPEE